MFLCMCAFYPTFGARSMWEKLFLKRVKLVWIQRFSFSLTGCLTKSKELGLPKYSPIPEETKIVSSRIRTCFKDSISHNDDRYAMCASSMNVCCPDEFKKWISEVRMATFREVYVNDTSIGMKSNYWQWKHEILEKWKQQRTLWFPGNVLVRPTENSHLWNFYNWVKLRDIKLFKNYYILWSCPADFLLQVFRYSDRYCSLSKELFMTLRFLLMMTVRLSFGQPVLGVPFITW